MKTDNKKHKATRIDSGRYIYRGFYIERIDPVETELSNIIWNVAKIPEGKEWNWHEGFEDTENSLRDAKYLIDYYNKTGV